MKSAWEANTGIGELIDLEVIHLNFLSYYKSLINNVLGLDLVVIDQTLQNIRVVWTMTLRYTKTYL